MEDDEVGVPQCVDFWEAAREGNLARVRELLEGRPCQINPNFCHGIDQETALGVACRQLHVAVVEYLVQDERVDVNLPNCRGEVPLMVVCMLESDVQARRLSRVLLQHQEIDVNHSPLDNGVGITPLIYAAQYNKVELVKLLLADPRVDLAAKDDDGCMAIHMACFSGSVEVMELFLSDSRTDVNIPDREDLTPLFAACQEGHTEIVRMLLAHPAVDANIPRNTGATPLNIACEMGAYDCVRLMVDDERVLLNMADNDNASPLWFAAQGNHTHVAKLLMANTRETIDAVARTVEGQNEWQNTNAVEWARQKGHKEMADLIEQYIADPVDTRLQLWKELGFGGTALIFLSFLMTNQFFLFFL